MERFLTIITGASSNHYACLRNLLSSIAAHEPDCRIVVYDLGLTNHELGALVKDGFCVRPFDFSQYPPHVNIRRERGQYAWKPIIVADALNEFGELLLWLDAGNLVHAPLSQVRHALEHEGIYTPTSAGVIRTWTHELTLKYLSASANLLDKRNRNAAIIGLASHRPGIRQLAERWKACAMDIDCIAPRGSSRKNHRQDQAVLSVLVYQFQLTFGFQLDDRRLQISTHNDALSASEARERILHHYIG